MEQLLMAWGSIVSHHLPAPPARGSHPLSPSLPESELAQPSLLPPLPQDCYNFPAGIMTMCFFHGETCIPPSPSAASRGLHRETKDLVFTFHRTSGQIMLTTSLSQAGGSMPMEQVNR